MMEIVPPFCNFMDNSLKTKHNRIIFIAQYICGMTNYHYKHFCPFLALKYSDIGGKNLPLLPANPEKYSKEIPSTGGEI